MTTLSHLLYRKMQFCTYHKKSSLLCWIISDKNSLYSISCGWATRISAHAPKNPHIRHFRVLAIKNSAQNVSLCAESFYECLFQDLSMLWCSFGHEWAFPLFLYHQALLFVIFLLMNFDYAMFPSFDRRRLFSALRYHLHILTIIV